MKKITLLSTIAIMTISAANAGAKSGIIVGGNIGISTTQNDLPYPLEQKHGIAGSGIIGYDYALSRNFSLGIESGYQYAKKIAGYKDIATVSTTSIPIFATAKYYIPSVDSFSLLGKLGYAYTEHSVEGLMFYNISKGWEAVAAAGLGYSIGNFTITTQYQYNWLKHVVNHKEGQGTYTVSLTYKI